MGEVIIGGDFFPNNPGQSDCGSSLELWGDFGPLFRDADLSILNLEAPLTYSDTPIKKTGPNLKLPPKAIDYLDDIDLVTLANNHILDYGLKGLEDTIENCKKKGVSYVGAGLSEDDARETLYKTVGGETIAIINFCENEWVVDFVSKAGAHSMDLIKNANQIKTASEKADYVLVIVHGGHELYHYPSPRMVEQYRFYAELGATAVVGHHTHCVSGYEVYKGCPIFYSIGNLVFPSKINFSGWYEGMLVNLKLGGGQIDWELLPYKQCQNGKCKISLLQGDEKKLFMKRIDEYSSVINDSNALNLKWAEFVTMRSLGFLGAVSVPVNILKKVLVRLGFADSKIFAKHFQLILNLVRCEAHRDLLIESLEKNNAENENSHTP